MKGENTIKEKKVFRMGPELLTLEYDGDSGREVWYDEHHNKIPNPQMVALMAWYSMAPVNIYFHRMKEDSLKEYDDYIEQREVERLLGLHKKYKKALKELLDYCAENTEDFYVEARSYVKGEEGYISVGYIFRYFKGCTRIIRVRYKEDDVEKAIIDTKELATEKEFIDFCRLKYDGDNFVYIEGNEWKL